MVLELLDLVSDVVTTAVREDGIRYIPPPLEPPRDREMFVCWHPGAERNCEWFEAVSRRCKAMRHIAPECGDVPRSGGGEQHAGDAIPLPKLPSHFRSGRDLIPSRHVLEMAPHVQTIDAP
jgi:hypothetical protein